MTDPRDDDFAAEDIDLNLDLDLGFEESDGPEIDLGEFESETAEPESIDLGEAEAASEPEINLDFASDVADAEDEPALSLSEDDDEQAEEADSSEADEAVEKALAELHDRLMMEPGEWYVIHTYSGMENRVRQNLESRIKTFSMEDYIFEIVVPTEQVDELRGNQRKTVTRTVLPGYVLVRMDMTDDAWTIVRHTPSVTGFVGHGQVPVSISLDEVEQMMKPAIVAAATADQKGPKRVKRKAEVVDFNIGDNVQVDDGPFAGMHATITELNIHNQRAKVLVELLGRETPMELTFAQIKKV